MARKITIMALVGGIVLGAATTEGFDVYRQSQNSGRRSHDSEVFQQRVHCKAVADAYVKEHTDLKDNSETGASAMLDKVDYSPARNSCVAELERTDDLGRTMRESSRVQDLLSGEILFSTSDTGSCLELKPELVHPAFDYIMNNASIPIEVEKKWALTESNWRKACDSISNAPASQPKSASFSGQIQIDPATGERESESPSKSILPSGR